MEKEKAFSYSTQQLILIIFLMVYFSDFLELTFKYGLWLGLPPGSNPTVPLGILFRTFFVNSLTPLLLVALLLSKYREIRLPNFHIHHLFMGGILTFTVLMVVQILLGRGAFTYFEFLGYTTLSASMLVYASVCLYLAYVFRGETFPKMLVICVLGVLAVGELWELPLNFVNWLSWEHLELHIFLFFVGYLRTYIPLILWFYMFRRVYRQFITKHWLQAVSMILVSFYLILGIIQGWYHLQVLGVTLRLTYATLLIFLPFHHHSTEP